MQWDKVKKYHLTPPTEFGEFTRANPIQLEYDLFKESLVRKNISILESIQTKYFDGNLESYVIVPNAFPYSLESNLEHLILWVKPGCEFDLNSVETCICEFMTHNYFSDWIYFKNELGLQSVLSILHWHIIGKR